MRVTFLFSHCYLFYNLISLFQHLFFSSSSENRLNIFQFYVGSIRDTSATFCYPFFSPLGKVHPCAKGQQNACSAATDMKLKYSVSAQKEFQPKHVLYKHHINYPASKRLKYTSNLCTALYNAGHQQMY